uniref:Uncharacterized protein n=1 Tax=Ditylenchus dipsaci TaxID=166011 RepID=A0A915DIJ4_9BILA
MFAVFGLFSELLGFCLGITIFRTLNKNSSQFSHKTYVMHLRLTALLVAQDLANQEEGIGEVSSDVRTSYTTANPDVNPTSSFFDLGGIITIAINPEETTLNSIVSEDPWIDPDFGDNITLATHPPPTFPAAINGSG